MLKSIFAKFVTFTKSFSSKKYSFFPIKVRGFSFIFLFYFRVIYRNTHNRILCFLAALSYLAKNSGIFRSKCKTIPDFYWASMMSKQYTLSIRFWINCKMFFEKIVSNFTRPFVMRSIRVKQSYKMLLTQILNNCFNY